MGSPKDLIETKNERRNPVADSGPVPSARYVGECSSYGAHIGSGGRCTCCLYSTLEAGSQAAHCLDLDSGWGVAVVQSVGCSRPDQPRHPGHRI